MGFLSYLANQNMPDDQWNNNNDPWNNNASMQSQVPEGMSENTGFTGTMFGSPNDGYLTGNYKKGGKVRSQKLRNIAGIIRSKGRHGDSILAHINPSEAMMLKQMGGSGTINPATGLPEFSWLDLLGGVGGSIIGNAILPGIGGAMLGGALGGGLGGFMQGGKKKGKSAIRGVLKGAGIGATGHALFGSAAAGATGAAGSKAANDVFSVLDKGNAAKGIGMAAGDEVRKSSSLFGNPFAGRSANELSGNKLNNMTTDQLLDMDTRKAIIDKYTPKSFAGKALDFVSKPETLLNLGTLGLNAYNSDLDRKERKKASREKSPEQLADEKKRYRAAMKLSPEEIAANDEYLRLLEGKQHHNSILPIINPLHRTQLSPEEYARTGKWFKYKQGGKAKDEMTIMEIMHPRARYMDGNTGGQDDKIPALLSDGEYVIDASTVADMGDGNSKKGATVLDEMVTKIRKKKRGGTAKLPPKLGNIMDYMR